MSEFAYKGKSRAGKFVTGTLSAKSDKEAKNALFNRGITPIMVKAVAAGGVEQKGGLGKMISRDAQGNLKLKIGSSNPSTKELAVFTKQFSLLVENGVPMMQSLNLLQDQQKKEDFRNAIVNISAAISEGATLFAAMSKYPKIFDSLYVSMIRAGEASGRLDVILRQLVMYVEKAAKIKSQIKSALMYPIIIMVVAVSVVSLLLAFVVPALSKQFKEGGKKLPLITEVVVMASDGLVEYWYVVVGALVVVGLGLRTWINTEKGRTTADTLSLKMPVIGDVLTKIAIGRFCSTMGTMLSSGVSILEALDICASSAGNKKVEFYVQGMKDEIAKGRSFAEPMSEIPIFPKMVSSMVAVGESTGTLDTSLLKITEIYDEEVDTAIDTMTGLIEPIMIVFIGSTVGFIVIAMYLPIFEMANAVGG